MVRANGSYPLCPGFKSLHRHHPLIKTFRRDIKALPLRDGDRVLAAVSGGGDSVGMLALLLSARPRPDLEIGVAHVHHNLRGEEADRDQAAVEALAGTLGLPFLTVRLEGVPDRGQSVEEWARLGRYAALENLRRQGGWDWVATAHSRDDQAETVLLRIGRGSGLQGLAGILPVSGHTVRPVLGLSGGELREAAQACGLRFLEDSTNRDRRYLRNRIRLDVLPAVEAAMPGFTRHLAALARLASEAPAYSRALEVAVFEGDSLYYDCSALAELTDGEGLAAMRQGLLLSRGHLRRIGEKHIRALWSLRDTRPGASVALPGGWEGVREKAGVRLRRRPGQEVAGEMS